MQQSHLVFKHGILGIECETDPEESYQSSE